jgi:hypothetical protein
VREQAIRAKARTGAASWCMSTRQGTPAGADELTHRCASCEAQLAQACAIRRVDRPWECLRPRPSVTARVVLGLDVPSAFMRQRIPSRHQAWSKTLVKLVPSASLVAAVVLAAPLALAQGDDIAAAQGLFDEAKQLVAAGKLSDACPKFLASFKADPKPGVAMNLADCYEKTGRTASAWARYLEAASLAQRAGQGEREKYSREHAARIEPSLSRLSVVIVAAPPGLQVSRDGTPIDPGSFGTAVPVDPGPHLIEAHAPGKKAWSKTVEVATGASRVSVEIPALEDGLAAGAPGTRASSVRPLAPVAPPSIDAPASTFPRKTVGFALIGVGGAGIVVGAVTGGLALSKHSALEKACPAASSCAGETSTISSFHTLGTVSDIGLFVGGAVAITGIVLVVTAPKAAASAQAGVTPVLGPGLTGFVGRF